MYLCTVARSDDVKVGGGARGSGRMEVYKVTLEVKMREQVKQQNRLVHVCGRHGESEEDREFKIGSCKVCLHVKNVP